MSHWDTGPPHIIGTDQRPYRRQPRFNWTPLHCVLLLALLMLMAGLAIDDAGRREKARRDEQELVIAVRAHYCRTGFCSYCNDARWLATLQPQACPICNPRGTQEVPFTRVDPLKDAVFGIE